MGEVGEASPQVVGLGQVEIGVEAEGAFVVRACLDKVVEGAGLSEAGEGAGLLVARASLDGERERGGVTGERISVVMTRFIRPPGFGTVSDRRMIVGVAREPA